jgi:uncharacterized protein YbbK (DUF523 family)
MVKARVGHRVCKSRILLSACLAGVNCVYDGSNKEHPVFEKLAKCGGAALFCPEVLGGLSIPHLPSEISGGDGAAVLRGAARVVSQDGADVTDFFLKGAKRALALAKNLGIKKAVMKARSPSCGCGKVYNGTFSRKLIEGYGVTAAMFREDGIEVVSDEEYLKERKATRRQGDKRTLSSGRRVAL